MSSGDSKQAEKEYLRRTAGGTWEFWKPFSPPGTDTLFEPTGSQTAAHDLLVEGGV
jgi:hypothetical protein